MTPDSESPPPAEFDRIVARRPAGPVTAGQRATASSDNHAARISATSFWIAAVALCVIAVLVFVLLPRFVSSPPAREAQSAAVVPTPRAQDPAPAASAPAITPPAKPAWDDAALLEARAAAQAARARFDEQLEKLQARGAPSWGAAALGKAQSDAAAGATSFASRDFPAARTAYEAAAAGTTALLAQIPAQLSSALSAGAHALEAGDKAAAQQAFDSARTLDPDNAQAQRGLERVASLDAVRAQLDTAHRLEQAGDLDGARSAWKQALALDRDTQSARDALARLDAQASDAQFRRALSDALDAIDHAKYEVADKQLARARALRPSDPGVLQAATRLGDARRGMKLAELQRQGASQVGAEDWAGAVTTYRAAQELDGTVAFAREGVAQAEPRAALGRRLQDYIDRPDRLTSAGGIDDAQRALEQARAVGSPGPRLSSQIASLEKQVLAASTPVDVQLQSDSQTDVTIYKIGPLGRFANHAMQLKPGHYVVIGSRAGYRDVRHELDVPPGAQGLNVAIRCEEAL